MNGTFDADGTFHTNAVPWHRIGLDATGVFRMNEDGTRTYLPPRPPAPPRPVTRLVPNKRRRFRG